MKTLSRTLALIVVIAPVLLAGWAMPERAVQTRTGCAAPAALAVPAEYLMYHALVAPQATLFERREPPASCTPRKVTRT